SNEDNYFSPQGNMASYGYLTAVMAATLVSTATVVSQEVGGPVEQVGVMVGQVVEHHLTGCHLVLITTTQHSHVFSSIIRHMGAEAGVVVEAGWMLSQDQLTQDHLLQGLWGDTRTTCRALILDLTTSNSTDLVFRLLESSGMWKLSETLVLVMGGSEGVEDVLLHYDLRNTVHAFYMALTLHDLPLQNLPRLANSRLGKTLMQEVSERVWVYRRCLYCNNGEADVQLIHKWNLTSLPQHTDDLFFHEQFHNFFGHKIQFSAVRFFPYMAFTLNSNDLDIREQPQRAWGSQKNGKFNGMLGQLQREEVDIGGPVSPQAERVRIIEFLGAYEIDVLSIVSLKPTPLPQHLSLMRPFAGELWVALLMSVVAWGVSLWFIHRARRWFAGGRGVKFTTAFLYGWGALLERPPSNPSVSDSGKVLVGWWLVFCVVMITGFRSSLISHLTVQGRTQSPETFEDLLDRSNWKWGIEHWMMRGMPKEYFSKHTDPVVKEINKKMEVLTADEALRKVKEGSYSLFSPKYHITVIIDSKYTNSYGQTPFYISKRGIVLIASFGKGSPYYTRFLQLKSRLEDAGIIQQWASEVISARVRENRAAAALDPQATLVNTGHLGISSFSSIHRRQQRDDFGVTPLAGCSLPTDSGLLHRLPYSAEGELRPN
ncbi:Glutamate receptor-like 28, partial [Homarus americanus]